jgi:transposase
MPRRHYPSALTNAQFARPEPFLPSVRTGGRPRPHPTREVVDALRYMLRGDIAWRALPHEYPSWQTVYHYFRMWRRDGTWERLNDELREVVRERSGRTAQPSAAILDSQSAKSTEKGASRRRRGQEAKRAQASCAGGYGRTGADQSGPSRRCD